MVAHLIERYYSGDLLEAVRAVYRQLEGHFAFVVVHRDASRPARGRAAPVPARGRHRGRRDLPRLVDRRLPARDEPRQADRGRRGRGDHAVGRALLPDRRRGCATARRSRSTGTTSPRSATASRRSCSRRSTSSRPRSSGRCDEYLDGDELARRASASRSEELAGHLARPHPRLRDRLPRGRRRALRDRGVGARSPCEFDVASEWRYRNPVLERGHARDRDLAVGRDPRHGPRGAARQGARRAHGRDHEPPGHADHPRGRQRALHARPAWRWASPRRRPSRRRSSCSSWSRSSSRRCAGRSLAEELAEPRATSSAASRPRCAAFLDGRPSDRGDRRGGTTTRTSSSTSAATSACPSASRARSS